MRRGTKVGQGYVAITADGTGMNDEIVDSVDKAGPDVEKAGDRAGKRYGDRFGEGLRSRMGGIREKVAGALNERLADAGKAVGDKIGDGVAKSLVDRMNDRSKSLGAGVEKNLNESVKGAGDKAGERIGSELVQRLQNDLRLANGRVTKAINKMLNYKGNDKDYFASLTASARIAKDAAANLERQLRKTMEAEGLIDGVSGNGAGRGRKKRSIGDSVGSLFGAGSRSNTLNLLGRTIGGIVNMTERLRKVGSSVFSMFMKGFTSAGEGASFLQKSMKGLTQVGAGIGANLSKAFAAGAAAAPVLIVALIAVVVAISALVSIVGALLGLMTAFAATLVSGVVGALAVATAGVFALIAAGGLLTAAFMSMTDVQKEMLKSAFRPLREEMIGIGQIVIQQMVPSFQIWAMNLQNAIALLEPLARVMGSSFANAGTILTQSLSGPGFQAFYRALAIDLPGIVTNLSNALGQFLNGLLGMFAVVVPYLARFSDYLSRTATRFSEWANSASGQNSIEDFVSRAVTSLESLWNAVREVSGFISDLLFSNEAQDAGNTIFDGIASTFRDMRDAIAEAAADGSLKKFFDDAINFGEAAWNAIDKLYDMLSALYSSGMLDQLAQGFNMLAFVFGGVAFNIDAMAFAIRKAGDAAAWAIDQINRLPLINLPGGSTREVSLLGGTGVGKNLKGPGKAISGGKKSSQMGSAGLIKSGKSAMKGTSGGGGGGGGGGAAQWQNPYTAYANSLISAAESMGQQIRDGMRRIFSDIGDSVADASRSLDAESVTAGLAALGGSIVDQAASIVSNAQSAVNSAAKDLASATSQDAANLALASLKQAQIDLGYAQQHQAATNQVAALLNNHGKVREASIVALTEGEWRGPAASLAEYAEARRRVAEKLEAATLELDNALNMRNEYQSAVTSSIKAFGSLITAQASTLNGVEQALTATDITTNLQDRLTKIRAFQENLRMLLAMGLSQDAYKQIVDAGVDGGSEYAEALLGGGISAVQDVNGLVDEIGKAATNLGDEASKRMYQAGVDAAQGLVDGLTSLASQLEATAIQMGNLIAAAVRTALGISSPSRVLIDDMNHVGDGAVIGLNNQHNKVGAAATNLAKQISVSPEAAQRASQQVGTNEAVSGNGNNDDPRFRDLVIHTPTEDPKAVAEEVLNEVTGRL